MMQKNKEHTRSTRKALTLAAVAVLVLAIGCTVAWFTFTRQNLNGTIELGQLSFQVKVYKEDGAEAISSGSSSEDVVYDIASGADWSNGSSGRRYIELTNTGSVDMRALLNLTASQIGMEDSNLSDFYFRLTDITSDVEKSGSSLIAYAQATTLPSADSIYNDAKSYMASELPDSMKLGSVKRGSTGYYALDYCCKSVPTTLLSARTGSATPQLLVSATITALQANAEVDLGVDKSKTYEVSDWVAFVDAVKAASDGDTVVLTKDITATDSQNLDLTRAVRLDLSGHKLVTKGDLRYEYSSSQETWVDLSGGATLTLGGNLYINTPNAKFTLIGGTNAQAVTLGTWASNKLQNGEYYVCAKEYTLDHVTVKVRTSSSGTKEADLQVGSGTGIVVSPQSVTGVIQAVVKSHDIQIYNSGTIKQIDLTSMVQAGYADKQIYIYNSGTVTGYNNYQVLLPTWCSGPVTVPDAPNTHIINAYGAVAIVSSKVQLSTNFQAQDIENMVPETNENVIRRAENDYLVIKDTDSQSVATLMSNYFKAHSDYAAEAATITSLTYVSASGAHFTSSDQNYAQQLSTLTTLDLSNAVYELNSGVSQIRGSNSAKWHLENLTLPKITTKLSSYAFANSYIDYVLIPGSITSISTDAFYGIAYNNTEFEWEPTSKNPDFYYLRSTYNKQGSEKFYVFTMANSVLQGYISDTSSGYMLGRVFEKEDFYDETTKCYVKKLPGGNARITRYVGEVSDSMVPKIVTEGTNKYTVTEIGADAYTFVLRNGQALPDGITLDLSQITNVGKYAFCRYGTDLMDNAQDMFTINSIDWNLTCSAKYRAFMRCNIGQLKTLGTGDFANAAFYYCTFTGDVDMQGNYTTYLFYYCTFGGKVSLLDGTTANGTLMNYTSFTNDASLICAGHNRFTGNTSNTTIILRGGTGAVGIPAEVDGKNTVIDFRGLQVNEGSAMNDANLSGGVFYAGNKEYYDNNQSDPTGFPYNLGSLIKGSSDSKSTIARVVLGALPTKCRFYNPNISSINTATYRHIRQVYFDDDYKTSPELLFGATTLDDMEFSDKITSIEMQQYGFEYTNLACDAEDVTKLLDLTFLPDETSGYITGRGAFVQTQFPNTLTELRLPADNRLSNILFDYVTMGGVTKVTFTGGNGKPGDYPFYNTSFPSLKTIVLEAGTLAFAGSYGLPPLSTVEELIIQDNCKITSIRFTGSVPKLKKIEIGNGVSIPASGFSSMNAPMLETLNFGDNCVMGNSAFAGATFGQLKSFTFKGTKEDGNETFYYTNFPELETFTLAPGSYMVPYSTYGTFTGAQFPKVTQFVVGDGSYICEYAFRSATFGSLESITLDNTSSYNNSAFFETKFPALDSITFLNNGSYTYGGQLFRYSNLTEMPISTINFADNMDVGSVFYYVKFTNITALDCSNVRSLAPSTFSYCEFPALERIDAHDILQIGYNCFGNITSPSVSADFSGVPFIGINVFQAKYVKDLRLGVTEESINRTNERFGTSYSVNDACFCYTSVTNGIYYSGSSCSGLFKYCDTEVENLYLDGDLPYKSNYRDGWWENWPLLGGYNNYLRQYDNVYVSSSCTRIVPYLFSSRYAGKAVIKNITFENPDDMPDIGTYAFYNADIQMGTLELKGSSIGDYAFQYAQSGLTKLVITGTGAETLARNWMQYSQIKTLVLKGTFLTVDSSAFSNASNLTTIRILSDTMLVIGSNASFPSTVKIYVPADLLDAYKEKYTYNAQRNQFYSDKQFYTNFTDASGCIWNYVFASPDSTDVYLIDMTNPSSATQIAVPAQVSLTAADGETSGTSYPVVGLAEEIFNASNLSGVTSISLPASVYDFTFAAFDSSVSTVPSIAVADGSQYFTVQDGTLLSADRKSLIGVFSASDTAYLVPDTVSGILSGAFRFTSDITSFVLPNTAIVVSADRFGDRFSSEITERADNTDQFYFSSTGATVHVPEELYSSYIHSPYYSGIHFALVGDVTRQTDAANVTWIYVGDTKLAVDGDQTDTQRIPSGAQVYTSMNALADTLSLLDSGTGRMPYADESGFAFALAADGTAQITAVPKNASGVLTLPVSVTAEGRTYAVTGVDVNALNSLPDVTAFALSGISKTFSVDEAGALYSLDGTVLYRYPAASASSAYQVPASVTRVEAYAFAQVRDLQQLYMGSDALRGCQTNAFADCPDTLVVLSGNRVMENQALFSQFMSSVDPESLRNLQIAAPHGTVSLVLDKDLRLNLPWLLGTQDVLTLPTPNRDGYTFGGWFLSEDLSGDPVTQLDAASLGGSLSLFAKWEPAE